MLRFLNGVAIVELTEEITTKDQKKRITNRITNELNNYFMEVLIIIVKKQKCAEMRIQSTV